MLPPHFLLFGMYCKSYPFETATCFFYEGKALLLLGVPVVINE